MLQKTRIKLASYRDNEPQIGGDGEMHMIDRVTRITIEQCISLGDLHGRIKPDLSIEVGLAYGFSTLPILDSMFRHTYGQHVAIDPAQMSVWNGVAFAAVQELGFTDRFTLMETRSDRAIVQMIDKGRRTQFGFLDGNHHFEGLLTDIGLLDQMMDIGGVIVVNDMWLPSVRSVAHYMRKNYVHYAEMPSVHDNIFVVRKERKDDRVWNHYVPFDASGAKTKPSRTRLGRIFSGR